MLYRVYEKIKSISNKRKVISLDYEMLYFRFIESFDYLVKLKLALQIDTKAQVLEVFILPNLFYAM